MADTLTLPRTKGAVRLAEAAKRRAAIVAAYRKLKAIKPLAERFQVSRQRVWQILKEEGVYDAEA